MDEVKDVTVGPCSPSSKYIRPITVHYTQDGVKKTYDLVHSHDCVCMLVHNTTRNVFVFVKQFRPAVYVCQVRNVVGSVSSEIDTKLVSPSLACTLELCGGILDKEHHSVEETAREELFEECGYDVPLNCLEKVISCRNNVGISGSQMTLFYARVTDEMKVGCGGGIRDEGEFIELVEVPVKDSLDLLMDSSIEKPMAVLFALMWFKQLKTQSI
jgi:UDP-sugar diphosphatase